MRGLRACPICPECGSKKFRRITTGHGGKEKERKYGKDTVIVECMKCSKRIKI